MNFISISSSVFICITNPVLHLLFYRNDAQVYLKPWPTFEAQGVMAKGRELKWSYSSLFTTAFSMIKEKYVRMERVNSRWSERAEDQDNEILYESSYVFY